MKTLSDIVNHNDLKDVQYVEGLLQPRFKYKHSKTIDKDLSGYKAYDSNFGSDQQQDVTVTYRATEREDDRSFLNIWSPRGMSIPTCLRITKVDFDNYFGGGFAMPHPDVYARFGGDPFYAKDFTVLTKHNGTIRIGYCLDRDHVSHVVLDEEDLATRAKYRK